MRISIWRWLSIAFVSMIAYSKTILVVLEEVCALVYASIASKIFCGDVSRDTLIQGPKTVLSEYHFRKHESYFLEIN